MFSRVNSVRYSTMVRFALLALGLVVLLAMSGCKEKITDDGRTPPQDVSGKTGPVSLSEETSAVRLPYLDVFGMATSDETSKTQVLVALNTEPGNTSDRVAETAMDGSSLPLATAANNVVYSTGFQGNTSSLASLTLVGAGYAAFIDSTFAFETPEPQKVLVGSIANKKFTELPLATSGFDPDYVANLASVGDSLYFLQQRDEGEGEESEVAPLTSDSSALPTTLLGYDVAAGARTLTEKGSASFVELASFKYASSQLFAMGGKLYFVTYSAVADADATTRQVVNALSCFDVATRETKEVASYTGAEGQVIGAGGGRVVVLEVITPSEEDEEGVETQVLHVYDVVSGKFDTLTPVYPVEYSWGPPVQLSPDGTMMIYYAGVGEMDEMGNYESVEFGLYDFLHNTVQLLPLTLGKDAETEAVAVPGTAWFDGAGRVVCTMQEVKEAVMPADDEEEGDEADIEPLAAWYTTFVLERGE